MVEDEEAVVVWVDGEGEKARLGEGMREGESGSGCGG